MPTWTTACPDWESRLRSGASIIPQPIYPDTAARALEVFKSLRVVDLPGRPTFGECSEQWVFDFVSAIFGAYNAETGQQLIREFLLLISKKNTKSTIAAGVMLTAVILCWRDDEEHLILAPTKEVADNSFRPAAGMVRSDPDLQALFHVQDHVRTITHRLSGASLKIVAADAETVSGKKAGIVLVDELWLFGKRATAQAMLMEATGGQVSRPEGFVVYLSTQSDDPPAGVWAEKLQYHRAVRDGTIDDPKTLPVLYEFPASMIEAGEHLLPENFGITNPNIGRSVSAEWLIDNLRRAQMGTAEGLAKFLAKHLNVQIGQSLRADRWAGADYWESQADTSLTLESLLERSEVVVAGIDGGGLDDLLGLCLIGRDKQTRQWLHWAHAWAHRIVLDRRKDIASVLLDFERDGDLSIVDLPGADVQELADILCRVRDAGLFPEKQAIGVDAAGIGEIVDELTADDRGFVLDHIVAVSQGWRLNSAIKTAERKVAGGDLVHGGTRLMAWCVGNAKTVPVGNAVSITKQVSGSAKIDPLMATFDAVTLMSLNPSAMADEDIAEFFRAPIIA